MNNKKTGSINDLQIQDTRYKIQIQDRKFGEEVACYVLLFGTTCIFKTGILKTKLYRMHTNPKYSIEHTGTAAPYFI